MLEKRLQSNRRLAWERYIEHKLQADVCHKWRQNISFIYYINIIWRTVIASLADGWLTTTHTDLCMFILCLLPSSVILVHLHTHRSWHTLRKLLFIKQSDTLINQTVWIFISPECFDIRSDVCSLISSHYGFSECHSLQVVCYWASSGRTLANVSVWLLSTCSHRCSPARAAFLTVILDADTLLFFLHNN